MSQKRIKTSSFQFRWAVGCEPEEPNPLDLGLKGAQFSTWDDLPRQQANERRMEAYRVQVRRAKDKRKKPPKKPTPIPYLAEGEEPDYEAIVEIVDCRQVDRDTYTIDLFIIFRDEHEIRLSFDVPYVPPQNLKDGAPISIPNVNLGRVFGKDLERRNLLISNMCSHVCRAAIDRMEALRRADG